MIGLKRGTVELVPHQKEWRENAEKIIRLLKQILGSAAVDIQHVGSTAIFLIHAKPIIDIAVAVHELKDVLPYIEVLKQHNIIFRGEIVPGEILFIMGNDDMRTHHIHIVTWGGTEWNNYINFRDFAWNAVGNVSSSFTGRRHSVSCSECCYCADCSQRTSYAV